MKQLIIIICTCIALMSCDSTRVEKAREQNEARIKKTEDSLRAADQNFLKSQIAFTNTHNTVHECNFIQKFYLVSKLPANPDTLEKCIKILTDSIYNNVPYSSDCSETSPRCGVYIATTKSFYDNEGWYVQGTQTSQGKADVSVNAMFLK